MGKAGESLAAVTGQAMDKLCRPVETEAAAFLRAAGPILDRFKRQQAIEDAIMAFGPDADEAAEILDAITESLRRRYEDNAEDALRVAGEFREALGEIEEPGDWKPDEMTLAKDAAIAESER